MTLTRLESTLVKILSQGPIPRHVAFIMDGNRRYARANRKRLDEGHSSGYLTLRKMLDMCYHLGIRCVSVYAFSIENFKRPEVEVQALMQLAESSLLELCSSEDILQERQVKLNVLGNKCLLPPAVQAAAQKAENLTRENNGAILNVCMPYTSRDEIKTAVQSSVVAALNAYQDEELSSPIDLGDATAHREIEAHLMTSLVGSPPLDILVRTSGVKRLSDFFLWQCCEGVQLHFSSTLWPDFTAWNMVPIILDYQRKIWSQRQQVMCQIPFRAK